MDISSDSQCENETPNKYFSLEKQIQDEDEFSRIFNKIFPEGIQPMSEDDLKEEKMNYNIYLQKENQFTQKEEKITNVSSVEQKTIQDHIKGVFQLFHPWTQEYNYNSFYSKMLLFNINYNILDNKETDPHKRKNMPDNMRKRIKTDVCSKIINNLNELLRPINIKFCYFSQCEIVNVTKEENKKILDMTLKEMILHRPFDYITQKNGKKEKDILNWEKNKNNLDYLEDSNHQDIYKQFNLENILNMKMKDLYIEYLASDEFQKSIEGLREEGNYFEYIQKYIKVAHQVIDYYGLKN